MFSNREVLIVQGKNSQFDHLVGVLTRENLLVTKITSPAEIIPFLSRKKPSLVLMDLLLDRKDAIDVLREIQQLQLIRNSTIVIFSERKENYVQVTALNAGADDFMVKPVNKMVFESRLRAWMRKVLAHDSVESSNGNGAEVILDQEKFSLFVKGEEIILQRKEFEIISLLASKPKKVFSRDEIKELVWGNLQDVRNRTIDVHIRNLRSKIGQKYIKTYKGIGYSFDAAL